MAQRHAKALLCERHPRRTTDKRQWQMKWAKAQARLRPTDLLLDLFLHCVHTFQLRVLEFVGGAAEVTQDVVAPIVQQNVLHLEPESRHSTAFADPSPTSRRHQELIVSKLMGPSAGKAMARAPTLGFAGIVNSSQHIPLDRNAHPHRGDAAGLKS